MSPRAWAMGMTLIMLASTAPAQQPAPPASPEAAPGAPGSAPSAAPARPGRRDRHLTAQERIEQRVRAMAEALKLNGDQQRELRIILMDQLEQIQKIRNDPSMAPEDRVGALRALNQQTSGRIHDILDEGQRKKYSPPPAQVLGAHSAGTAD
jgi:hypothetical protein